MAYFNGKQILFAPLSVDLSIKSWEDLRNVVRSGKARNHLALGDQFFCDHTVYGELCWEVIGFDQDNPVDGIQKHSLTLMLRDAIRPKTVADDGTVTYLPFNPTGDICWKSSKLRSWLNSMDNNGFMRGLDEDFVNVIGTVVKPTAEWYSTTHKWLTPTDDKIFIPSITELYGGLNSGLSEGVAYSYFVEFSDLAEAGTGADSNRIKIDPNSSYRLQCWTRSTVSNQTTLRMLGKDGSIVNNNGAASATYNVVPCCVIC